MTSHFAVLAIDAHEPAALARFWCATLGWTVLEVDDSIVSIGSAEGAGPTIDLTSTCGPTPPPRGPTSWRGCSTSGRGRSTSASSPA